MTLQNQQKRLVESVSCEFFRTIEEEIFAPIDDPNLSIDLVCELYISKIVYLKNLQTHCFKNINKKNNTLYNDSDLQKIILTILCTEDLLKEAIIKQLKNSMDKFSLKVKHEFRT